MSGAAKKIGEITYSTCSERAPAWKELVVVPLEKNGKGKLSLPVGQTLKEQDKMGVLAEATQGKGIVSIRTTYEGTPDIMTYLHLEPVHFKLGKAIPIEKSAFEANVASAVRQWRLILTGRYACLAGEKTPAVAYVTGYTDRLGREKINQELSEKRAKAIAESILQGAKSAMPESDLTVCYTGVGENETPTEDGIPMPEARRADVVVTSGTPPFQAKWTCLK